MRLAAEIDPVTFDRVLAATESKGGKYMARFPSNGYKSLQRDHKSLALKIPESTRRKATPDRRLIAYVEFLMEQVGTGSLEYIVEFLSVSLNRNIFSISTHKTGQNKDSNQICAGQTSEIIQILQFL